MSQRPTSSYRRHPPTWRQSLLSSSNFHHILLLSLPLSLSSKSNVKINVDLLCRDPSTLLVVAEESCIDWKRKILMFIHILFWSCFVFHICFWSYFPYLLLVMFDFKITCTASLYHKCHHHIYALLPRPRNIDLD